MIKDANINSTSWKIDIIPVLAMRSALQLKRTRMKPVRRRLFAPEVRSG